MNVLFSSGLKIHTSLGDGNCLFRTFSKELLSSEKHNLRIRTLLTDAVKWNTDIFHGYLTPPLTGKSIIEHVHMMQKEFTWGTHVEIYAMASVLQVPILLYTKKNKDSKEYYWHVFQPRKPLNTSFLLSEEAWKKLSPPPGYQIELLNSSATHFDLVLKYRTMCRTLK